MTESSQLSDKFDVIQLVNRHAMVLDAGDFDGLNEIYAPDVTGDFWDLHDRGRVEGRDTIVNIYRSGLTELAVTQHIVAGHVIDLDGDTATVTSYFFGMHITKGNARIPQGDRLVISGTYVDTCQKRDGKWWITHHVIRYQWTEGNLSILYPIAGL